MTNYRAPAPKIHEYRGEFNYLFIAYLIIIIIIIIIIMIIIIIIIS